MDGFDFIENSKELLKKTNDEKKQIIEVDNLPWIEKYRPKTINDIVCQQNIINGLKLSIKNNNLPHMLFYGPPGTGKTSTILAIGRKLFGDELAKKRIIELNASDDRGINSVRDKIKLYAKNAVSNGNNKCPKYKIIILDEADSMTRDAQSALRKIMEDYSNVTRFCFICNYINNIIEPITSRCAQYGFMPLKKSLMQQKLMNIACIEKMDCTKKIIKYIVNISDGDMRKATMMLQNIKYNIASKNITREIILEMNGYMNDSFVDNIIDKIKKTNINKIASAAKNIIDSGYSVDYFMEQFYEKIIDDIEICDRNKSLISIYLSANQKKIIDGADEYIQLLDMLVYSHITIQHNV